MWMSFHLRDTYQRKLRVITESANPQPAERTGAKECQRSGVCCWRRPCELFPGDPEKIAAHLGTTPQELFRESLVVDEIGGRLMLVPRRGEQRGGRFLDSDATYDIDTPCVFLDTANANACRIHDVKPTGGRVYHCAMSRAELEALPRAQWKRADLLALGWDGDDGSFRDDGDDL